MIPTVSSDVYHTAAMTLSTRRSVATSTVNGSQPENVHISSGSFRNEMMGWPSIDERPFKAFFTISNFTELVNSRCLVASDLRKELLCNTSHFLKRLILFKNSLCRCFPHTAVSGSLKNSAEISQTSKGRSTGRVGHMHK